MGELSKGDILAADDAAPVRHDTPEWAGYVFVRPITCDDRDRYEQWTSEKRWPEQGDADWAGLRARLVGLALCDSAGALHNYTDAELLALGQKGAAMERLFRLVRDISGMAPDAEATAEKNLPTDQNDSSG
jgi:hypothetical protein